MSRIFEFRVWDTLNKRYDKNYHITIGLDGTAYNLQNGAGGIDYVIQQFTGIFDRNKKKIFEGDILKVDRCHTVSRQISKSCYTCDLIEDGTEIAYIYFGSVEWLMSFDHIRHDDIQKMMDVSHRLEIIGNIFENPHLVKYI